VPAPRAKAIQPEQFTSFGQLLRFLRQRAGLTQRELSIAVGYNESQLSRLEQNQRAPDEAALAARFVPALRLEHEAAWVERLLALGAASRLEGQLDESAPASEAPLIATNLPGGTVTLLFTDLEGSTRLLQQLGDGYAAVLSDTQALLRNAFARWNGQEVDTQGDSFFVAFNRANDAVQAAVEAQKALAGHSWPPGIAVQVRMGLHTGEPHVTGGRYVGLDVHRAARIGAAAHRGQAVQPGAASGTAPMGVLAYNAQHGAIGPAAHRRHHRLLHVHQPIRTGARP
jgi:class 3 adenylate cyclase